MSSSLTLPELLAPAGSMESLIAAVSAGADAVYLSGRRFGARFYAANFDDEELKQAVEHSHVRGVKVYVTLNTLVHDDELPEVVQRLVWLYEAGVDAVLMQDIGAISLARSVVPNLPVHASTQMTLHNREGVQWACEQGMKRVVLARELSAQEVYDIGKTAECNTELELFIHGALCYCYSGQCLFSSLIGGRSGNRGMCAQPCRKPYRLVSGNKDDFGRPRQLREVGLTSSYLLSPHDLCVYPYLDKVVRLPVVSLKIEGRMKSPEYVATVVSIYRHALDMLGEGRWHPTEEDITELLMAFNRGFTSGYLMGERGRALMGLDRPDNRGVRIGSVVAYNGTSSRARVHLEGTLIPEPGDGLVISGSPGGDEAVGVVIRHPPDLHRGCIEIKVPCSVSPGADVYMTRQKRLSEKLKTIMGPKRGGIYSALPVEISLWWEDGVPILRGTVFLPGDTHIEVDFHGWFRMEPARSRPLKPDQIAALMKRTGGTPFVIKSLNLSYPGNLFAPLSEMNDLRRAFISRLEEAIIRSYIPSPDDIAVSRERCMKVSGELLDPHPSVSTSDRPLLAAYVNSIGALKGALEGGCAHIYYETGGGCGHGSFCEHLEDACALCERYGAYLVWKWPRITRRDFLDRAVQDLKRTGVGGFNGIMVENVGAARAVRRVLPDIPLYGSAGLNVFNHRTAWELGRDFFRVTISQELRSDQIRRLAQFVRQRFEGPALEYIVHGAAELVVSENSLLSTVLGEDTPGHPDNNDSWWGIEDSKGHIFPVVVDPEGRTHIYNGVETCLIDYLPDLCAAGIDALAIDARNRTGAYAREVVARYVAALDLVLGNDPDMYRKLEKLKKELKVFAFGGITTGHFLSGLLDR
jgi:putative protease